MPLELHYTDLPKTLVRGWRRTATDWEKTFANHISDRTIKDSQNSAIRKSKFKMVTEDTQMANKHMKRCSRSLIMRKRHMKTTLRSYYVHIGMTRIKEVDHTKC